jgi:hypothetical protein
MRANMKKLTLLVAVFSIASFMTVAMALAGGQDWKAIQGEYAVVGSGQCAISFSGIAQTTLLPLDGSSLDPGPVTYYDGVYKFSPNDRGSASLYGRSFTSAGGQNDPVGGWVQVLKFDFHYTVKDGAITFTTIPGTDTSTTIAGPGTTSPPSSVQLSSGPQHGNISPDGNILLIHCGAPVILDILGPDEKPLGPELLCNINLNGFKQWPSRMQK